MFRNSIRTYWHHHEIREKLGLPKKLPAHPVVPNLIDGIWYFLFPAFKRPIVGSKSGLPREGKSSKHRMYAICPSCATVVPAGRLRQHEGSQKCEAAYRALPDPSPTCRDPRAHAIFDTVRYLRSELL